MPNLLQGATDIDALLYLKHNIRGAAVSYLPRLHAKVYIADGKQALLGSANFTDGGAFRNLEYGVRITDSLAVQQVKADIETYEQLGSLVSSDHLQRLQARIKPLRQAIQKEETAIRQTVRETTRELQREAEDDLLRIRVYERSINAIFSDTILYLLARQSMTTREMNEEVREIHPDLCDDALDRVIDGKHFGKLWKHRVRSAQVGLRRTGRIVYDPERRLWHRHI